MPPAPDTPTVPIPMPRAGQAPTAVRLEHRNALLAAGIGAVLSPHVTVLDGRCDPRRHDGETLHIVDLDQATTRFAGHGGAAAPPPMLVVESGMSPGKARRLLKSGICACVSAEAHPEEIVNAVHALAAGRPYFCAATSAALTEALLRPGLTSREDRVLELLCEGLDNKTIAARLQIAPGTVKCHVKSVLAKTGTRSRTALAAEALKRGWT